MKKIYSILLLFILYQCIVVAQSALQEYQLGLASLKNGNYQNAIDHFTVVIKKEPENTKAILKRGIAYIELNDFSKALTDLEEADNQEKNIAAYYIAQVYALQNDVEKSIEYLTIHLKSKYKLPESEIRLDSKFNGIQNTQQWIDLWKNDWYAKKELMREEVKYLYSKGLNFEALEITDKALKTYKKDHELYALRAEIYSALNNPKATVVNYNKAIELNKRIPEYYINRGSALLLLDKNKEALNDFERAIQISDEHISLYLYKAQVLNEMEKYSLAYEEVKKYLQLLPEDDEALLLCGKILYNNHQYNEAIPVFSQLIKKDSSQTSYYMLRAGCYYDNKQYQKAYEDYTMALDLDPKNPVIYLQRGNSRLRSGLYKGACSDWEKADKMGSLEAKKNLMQFCN